MSADRLRAAWKAVQGTDPLIRYRCIYRAKVISQSGDLQTVGVRPMDPTLPDMDGIPIRHGIPGVRVQVEPGCTIQIGWDDGRPDRPFAALWSSDARATRIVIPSPNLELGSENPPDFALKGTAAVSEIAGALNEIAGALFTLGQIPSSITVAAAAANLPGTLSTRVSIG